LRRFGLIITTHAQSWLYRSSDFDYVSAQRDAARTRDDVCTVFRPFCNRRRRLWAYLVSLHSVVASTRLVRSISAIIWSAAELARCRLSKTGFPYKRTKTQKVNSIKQHNLDFSQLGIVFDEWQGGVIRPSNGTPCSCSPLGCAENAGPENGGPENRGPIISTCQKVEKFRAEVIQCHTFWRQSKARVRLYIGR